MGLLDARFDFKMINSVIAAIDTALCDIIRQLASIRKSTTDIALNQVINQLISIRKTVDYSIPLYVKPDERFVFKAFEKEDISIELAKFLGYPDSTKLYRTDVAIDVREYVGAHALQNPNNMDEIFLDETLGRLFNLDLAVKRTILYSDIGYIMNQHLGPVHGNIRKIKDYVMDELESMPKSQSSRRNLRRFARDNPGIVYNDSSDSEDESNYRHVTSRSLM
jgi:SWIB/MDM2 domain